MRLAMAVAAGGALGSWARWAVGGWAQRRAAAASGWIALVPAGTLVVNLVGCFAIGALAGWFEERGAVDPTLRIFLLVGVLGGFTTFSSFGFETLALARDGNWALAAGNVVTSVAGGLAGVWLGLTLARAVAGGPG
jgi:CrcB protein